MELLKDDAAQKMKDARKLAGDYGKFYTPEEVCRLCARLAKVPGAKTIYDPTCGTGSMLLYAREEIGGEPLLCGEEILEDSVALCRKNMERNGARFQIERRDVLLDPFDWRDFDVVVANPPFGVSWNPNGAIFDPDFPVKAPKSRADLAFVQRALGRVRKGGKAAVVVSPSVLIRGGVEAEIRARFVGRIETVVALPSGIFDGTGISTCLLVFGNDAKDVLFVDATSFVEGKPKRLARIGELVELIERREDSDVSKLVPNDALGDDWEPTRKIEPKRAKVETKTPSEMMDEFDDLTVKKFQNDMKTGFILRRALNLPWKLNEISVDFEFEGERIVQKWELVK